MTENEIKQLAGLWAMYAGYYRTKLDDQVLRMYADDLADLDFAEVRNALDQYRKNPKNRVLPLPAMIREIIEPQVDPDSAAREIASRIVGAISKCGWSNPTGAREYMGEIGWEIVRRFGGWQYICENHGLSLQPAAFMAQARDLAKSQLQFSPDAMAKAIGASTHENLVLTGKIDPEYEERKEHILHLAKFGIVPD